MNAPRNDKDHFLYPYEIVVKVIFYNHTVLQHKDIGILPSLQEKRKGSKYLSMYEYIIT